VFVVSRTRRIAPPLAKQAALIFPIKLGCCLCIL
jgi:hypothetical protein